MAGLAVTLLAGIALAACAATAPPRPAVHRSEAAAGGQSAEPSSPEMQRLDDDLQQMDEKAREEARALQAEIRASSFRSLSGDAQYQTLKRAAKVSDAVGDTRAAYGYLGRAIAMPQAGFDDRLAQVRMAVSLHREEEVIGGLTVIAERWPEQLPKLDSDFISRAIYESDRRAHAAAFPLLQALYGAHWKVKWGFEPSAAWRDLSLFLLERGRTAEAADVAAHVTDVYVLIAMRADRRFDAVVAAGSAHFDIDAAAEREVRDYQEASDRTPKSLQLEVDAIEALRIQQHYAAMLAASDAVLQQIRSTNSPEELFDDYGDYYSAFLEDRAVALEGMGRWDEALEQMIAASRRFEKGAGNVSQLIDLGNLYCDLGRPKDALAALASMVADASAYGNMVEQGVRVDAATQMGDVKRAGRLLEAMRARRGDAPFEYLSALIAADQPDRAARYLVELLLDPNERQEALQGVQTYLEAPSTPRQLELEGRWHAVIARQDVQAAVRKVGRIDAYRVVGS
jgi:hypothetical protein